jgi:hypothetical protein
MFRKVFGVLVLVGMLFVVSDVAEAKKSKCRFKKSTLDHDKKKMIDCEYRMKKKKSKLRELARKFCRSKGFKNIKSPRYSRCNKREKRCKKIQTDCIK